MIKANESEVELNGREDLLLTEFTIIIKALLEKGISEERIRDAVDMGFMNDEEIYEKLIDTVKDFFEELKKDFEENKPKKKKK